VRLFQNEWCPTLVRKLKLKACGSNQKERDDNKRTAERGPLTVFMV